MLAYAIPIIFSAFLLFLVQPLIGKFILPWFGGTPSVWTACMLFFQVFLLFGYAYAHASVSYLKPRAQSVVHLVLLLAALATLPVIPGDAWKPVGTESAEWRILALLLVTVGLPFLVLSATAPLLQAWFSRQNPGASPYRLYAFSNGASLAGLLCYPFMIEPAIRLRSQAWAWSLGFGCFALACGWCALRRTSASPEPSAAAEKAPAPPVALMDRALWLAWSACGSVMLLATTSQLTQNVAVVPMLWILPLALYLLTFVLCFDSPRWYWRPLWLTSFVLAAICVPSAPFLPLAPQITLYCATLFSACMICHGELARLKPPASRLTGFYLLVAVGGALGGVFCSLIAPVAFTGLWEYPCGLAALCLLLLVALVRFLIRLWSLNPRVIWGCILVITAVAMTNFVMRIGNLHTQALATTRNFYGVLVVDEKTGPRGPVRRMLHGRVSHGIQFLDEPLRRTPVAYHGAGSGLGLAEAVLRRCVEQEAPPRPLRIGVAGLGAGILAAYGRKGDTLRFYEINPDVVRLAHEYFTYLSDTAATVEMVQGDARMVMEQERAGGTSQQFDLLALDAFSGDAVPLHLLTREAFALYVYHLAPRGVLAFNISSQHLDMAPLIFGLARDGGKRAVLIEDWHRDDPQYFSNRWVLVSSDEAFLQAPEITGRAVAPGDPSAWLCFTDDYSNLFQLVKKRDGPRDGDGKSVH